MLYTKKLQLALSRQSAFRNKVNPGTYSLRPRKSKRGKHWRTTRRHRASYLVQRWRHHLVSLETRCQATTVGKEVATYAHEEGGSKKPTKQQNASGLAKLLIRVKLIKNPKKAQHTQQHSSAPAVGSPLRSNRRLDVKASKAFIRRTKLFNKQLTKLSSRRWILIKRGLNRYQHWRKL